MVGLTVAGPHARDVLQQLTDTSLASNDFPFMAFRKVDLGMAPVWLSRMTYSGDLGYEIWVQPEYQRYLFDLIWEAGQPYADRLLRLPPFLLGAQAGLRAGDVGTGPGTGQ